MSSGISESILFIGAITATMIVVASLHGVSEELSSGISSRSSILASEMQSRVSIINDPAHVETSPLTIYVKNTGTTEIYTTGLHLLIDGQAEFDWDIEVEAEEAVFPETDDDDTILLPGEVGTITFGGGVSLDPGDHLVTVITRTNAEDTMEFTA